MIRDDIIMKPNKAIWLDKELTSFAKMVVLEIAIAASTCWISYGSESQILQDDPDKRIDLTNAVNRLKNKWSAEEIAWVEVLYISTNSVFRMNVPSALIESAYDYKLVVRHFPRQSSLGGLVKTLGELHPQPSGKVADLRWACVFFDKSERRVFALHFDASGKMGLINGCCVDFNSDRLRGWAETNFGIAFR